MIFVMLVDRSIHYVARSALKAAKNIFRKLKIKAKSAIK